MKRDSFRAEILYTFDIFHDIIVGQPFFGFRIPIGVV